MDDKDYIQEAIDRHIDEIYKSKSLYSSRTRNKNRDKPHETLLVKITSENNEDSTSLKLSFEGINAKYLEIYGQDSFNLSVGPNSVSIGMANIGEDYEESRFLVCRGADMMSEFTLCRQYTCVREDKESNDVLLPLFKFYNLNVEHEHKGLKTKYFFSQSMLARNLTTAYSLNSYGNSEGLSMILKGSSNSISGDKYIDEDVQIFDQSLKTKELFDINKKLKELKLRD